MKYLIRNSIQETMLLPLWGRGTYSRLFPQILEDDMAQSIIEKLNYDFSQISMAFNEYGGVCYIVRARVFDNYIKEFTKINPFSCIINLGAGLDTTFSRVDNDQIHWYNIDLPDAISFRESLIEARDRETNLTCSIFDYSWMDKINCPPEDGVLILAAGLFPYFYEDQIKSLMIELASRFPLGEIFFDIPSKIGLIVANRMVKKSGISNAPMYFGMGNTHKTIQSWSANLELIKSFSFFTDIPRLKEWRLETKLRMFLCDKWNMVRFILLKFKNKNIDT